MAHRSSFAWKRTRIDSATARLAPRPGPSLYAPDRCAWPLRGRPGLPNPR